VRWFIYCIRVSGVGSFRNESGWVRLEAETFVNCDVLCGCFFCGAEEFADLIAYFCFEGEDSFFDMHTVLD
jgi:hypothetical protein